MDHYIDINILPDPDPDSDFSNSFLLRAAFNKLHKALVELKSDCIGISFPNYPKSESKYKKGLGNQLRLHGNKQNLAGVMETNWLFRMGDYLSHSDILPVPEQHSFVSVRRKQNKYGNIPKLRRNYIKRHGVTEVEAEQAYPDTLIKRKTNLPYLTIKSSSTGQNQFPLFIEQKVIAQVDASETETVPKFNSYGLSKEAVLPFF